MVVWFFFNIFSNFVCRCILNFLYSFPVSLHCYLCLYFAWGRDFFPGKLISLISFLISPSKFNLFRNQKEWRRKSNAWAWFLTFQPRMLKSFLADVEGPWLMEPVGNQPPEASLGLVTPNTNFYFNVAVPDSISPRGLGFAWDWLNKVHATQHRHDAAPSLQVSGKHQPSARPLKSLENLKGTYCYKFYCTFFTAIY